MSAYLACLVAVSLLATGLITAPAAADIAEGDHTLEFVDPGLRIWFDDEVPSPLIGCASGLCVTVDRYDLEVDAKGKITGFLRLVTTGVARVVIEGPVKGNIKGKDGSAKQSLGFKLSGDIYGMQSIDLSLKCVEEIGPDGSVEAYCKGKVCTKGTVNLGCMGVLDPYAKQLSPTDGNWSLAVTVPASPDAKHLDGGAVVYFDDWTRDPLSYTIKGSYSAKKDVSKLSLKGANDACKGSKVQLKDVSDDAGSGMFCVGEKSSFKIQGQSAKFAICEQ